MQGFQKKTHEVEGVSTANLPPPPPPAKGNPGLYINWKIINYWFNLSLSDYLSLT